MLAIDRYEPEVVDFSRQHSKPSLCSPVAANLYPTKPSSLNLNSASTNYSMSNAPSPRSCHMSNHSSNPRISQERLNGFHIPSSEEALGDLLDGTHITVSQGNSFVTGFNPASSSSQISSNHHQSPPLRPTANMDRNMQYQQQEIPDQLLSQFSPNRRPEDKPFSYIPTGGIAELQQRSTASVRQREFVPPPGKSKPKMTNRQPSYTGSESSQTSYDPASLFTPAYREMMKSQQEMLSQPSPTAIPADMIGFGPGKIPQEDVAAYILQPDGTMAAIRWSDRPGPDLQNSAVMAALVEEQNAQMHGTTSGRIHPISSGGNRQGMSFKVLQWLTGTDSEDGSETASNYSGSHDGQYAASPTGRRLKQHQSFDSHKFPEKIHEDDNGNELEFLYSGSKLPSKSFRRLLRSVSSTTASTDDVNSLPSPNQESPASSEGKPRRHGIKIVSRGSSEDKITPTSQQQPQERVAYCDF